MIAVRRKYGFSASHRLHVPAFTEERNDELFGKCNNPYGHGHNYEIEVAVEGPIDAATGRAVDLGKLDALVRETVLRRYDHRYLNEELPEFTELVPTTENLGFEIARRLKEVWGEAFPAGGPELGRIRIYETPRNIIEVAL